MSGPSRDDSKCQSFRKRSRSPLGTGTLSVNVMPYDADNQTIVSHKNIVLGLSASKFSEPMFTRSRNTLLNRNKPSVSLIGTSSESPPIHDLGDCHFVCEFCGALFWNAERLASFPATRRPRYTQCCKVGSVRLCLPRDPPDQLKQLIEHQDYLEGVRAYNSMFAMTSFGAKVDRSVNSGSGPYVFKVEGQISHWLGSLCPSDGEPPRFLQMYIYDTDNEIHNRMQQFSESHEVKLSEDIVRIIKDMLDVHNELVKLFRTARDICSSDNIVSFNVCLYKTTRQVSYDTPSPNTMGAIVHEGVSGAEDFDIVIRHKDGRPQRINKLHSLYMPLQYPLLHIYGEHGWSPDMCLAVGSNRKNNRLTLNMYYSFMMHDRHNHYSLILRSGRLSQQYFVDAYICIEQNRLDYVRLNQNLFRTEFLQGVHDAISKGDTESHSVGKRVILPSSFTGGPRYMYKHYHDALAICRVYGNPQFFITFTCNVKWQEITRYMAQFPSLKPQDRPDIISRIFNLKVEAFRNFIKNDRLFGTIIADMYTIEFQKRGLPHCHMLFWVSPAHKIITPADVDRHISAEIPNPDTDPELHRIVSECMIHGPCGLAKPNAPCMNGGVCSKGFPKRYQTSTTFDKNGYILYKRSADGFSVKKNNIEVDNAYVVPYNKTLSLRFNAHINVEYCGWNMMIKYLFKYVSKGSDRVHFKLTRNTHTVLADRNSSVTCNEIENFVDGRFICPHEAAWRIFNFPIHHRYPAVQVLAVHLENMQHISLRENQKLLHVVNNSAVGLTTLTEWFTTNVRDPSGRHLKYIDFLSEYKWEANGKCWVKRSYKSINTIGRLAYVHPSCGERFYLRMLLNHQIGCRSFTDIRTIDGIIYDTYRLACEKLGLLVDDNEWSLALDEAKAWATPTELRTLFAHILLHCEVANPLKLWENHWRSMSDDITRNTEIFGGHVGDNVSDETLCQYVLYELEFLLNSHSTDSSLKKFGLPMPNTNLIRHLKNRLLMEEKNYNREHLLQQHREYLQQLHPQQRVVYDYVVSALKSNTQILAFVYGHGGTGKTFLWTTITNYLRSQGKIVLTVAASGIASLLLPNGRTAHSRFKIPIDLTDDSNCNISKNSYLSELLVATELIIWDEAPMSDRKCFESLDRTLKDILNSNKQSFGGKSILLGGDFRQTLPVKKKASKSQIISSSLPRSYLWPKFRIFKLTQNMRVLRPNMTSDVATEIQNFSNWLLSIGDGLSGVPDEQQNDNSRVVKIPSKYIIPNNSEGISKLIHFIYDENSLIHPTTSDLAQKAIVCPKNDTADHINQIILNMLPGVATTYSSTDVAVPHAHGNTDIETTYPVEYLNTIRYSGFPTHHLQLKLNVPIILLRNINQTTGLCNGTRLLVTQLLPRLIQAKVITGTAIGNKVYIPRICLCHDDKEQPFIFKRIQFPVKVCYAMTINKSQGQSLNKIGVYLPHPVFSHGQLYVAFSRATSPDSLKILIESDTNSDDHQTKNIVYSDFLQEINSS